ncbi:MAG: hypothetical protein BZ135_01800 [Methanosphaera sp. rholeuAM6]|nr:MAG: hypothetical protein BZ135_01800 [Methanosphaera sp. rholeuAM6]
MNNKKSLFMLALILLILTIATVNAYTNLDNNKTQSDSDNIYNTRLDVIVDNITEKYTKDTNNNFTLLSLNKNQKKENQSGTAKLNKSKPIYFAMDHVNANDEEIRDTIVNKLEQEGFDVVTAEIGPNEMSRNTHYIYDNNISDVIIFHLFNGVDPSTIRELGTNGNDNRGRIVRSNNNDVVLAWFYDSADCVNDNGSGINYVYGSETGPSLENPKEYMEDNDIIGICTSSDMGNHTEDADYTGEKTVEEFMKLFY